MKTKITVSAPGKLMLLGEHAVIYGHPCIVTAVDQRLYLTAEFTDKANFELNAPDVNIKNYKKPLSQLGRGDIPKGARFVELATAVILSTMPAGRQEAKNLTKRNRSFGRWSQDDKGWGIKITTHSDFSSKYGFGSSSASTVCTIFALTKLFNLKLTQKQIFDLAYKTILDIQGKGSGFDAASAIYGGTIYFVTGGKAIQPLNVKTLPLIVGYSGIKADTATIIAKVAGFAEKYPKIVKKTYEMIEKTTNNGKKAIKNGNFETLGELFNINQSYLETLGVSSNKLSAMIHAAREAGAYGAKLSGAGIGDCMIAIAPPSKKVAVEKAITLAGGKIITVKTNAQGVRVER